MKVLQINTTFKNGGSTGRIAFDLLAIQKKVGIDGYVAYGRETGASPDNNILCLQGVYRRKLNILRTRLFDHHGFYNEKETKRLLSWTDGICPDIIHLHNIHNHYVNVKMLFEYIKKHRIPVVWTLHDCWSFTGHCAYFDYAKCDRWKYECHDCPSLKEYPKTWFVDRSRRNFQDKQQVFIGVENLTLVTPSQWLANLTRESFLKKYPVEIIYNGINTEAFCPTQSDIKSKLGIGNRKLILACASIVDRRKGLEYLLQLPSMMKDEMVLVIVGLKEEQLTLLPKKRCIGITRTDSIQELVKLYSAADVFINPTLEDNFPTTNIESLACGVPVVTFATGGSVEAVSEDTGLIVPKGDIEGLYKSICQICNKGKTYYSVNCRNRALQFYNKEKQYMQYIKLYQRIIGHNE